jgi:hypothetical protein
MPLARFDHRTVRLPEQVVAEYECFIPRTWLGLKFASGRNPHERRKREG